MSAVATTNQPSIAILLENGGTGDVMTVQQFADSNTVHVEVHSYDAGNGPADTNGIGVAEQPGLNLMVSVPVIGGGTVDFYLASDEVVSTPAPSAIAMLLSGLGGLGLVSAFRRRK